MKKQIAKIRDEVHRCANHEHQAEKQRRNRHDDANQNLDVICPGVLELQTEKLQPGVQVRRR